MAALVAAVVGILLVRDGRTRGRRWLQVAGWIWLAYGLGGIAVQLFSPDANIRVDLVLFHPLLVLGLLDGLLIRPRRHPWRDPLLSSYSRDARA